MNARLRNFWCPKCHRWIASLEVGRDRKHDACGTVVEWREFPLVVNVSSEGESINAPCQCASC